MPNPILVPHTDKETLSLAGGSRIINVLATAVAEQGTTHIALTGGTMGIAVLVNIAQNPLRSTV
ncbi:MAG: 6-phosphogluconolactonase, partial [Rothia sp. (in: high G+C Gram-positive bacteria)]|nr:6-phosphogluconolactonase [Rothia sp. (in: high G+C Gram-positive bacteria)]